MPRWNGDIDGRRLRPQAANRKQIAEAIAPAK